LAAILTLMAANLFAVVTTLSVCCDDLTGKDAVSARNVAGQVRFGAGTLLPHLAWEPGPRMPLLA